MNITHFKCTILLIMICYTFYTGIFTSSFLFSKHTVFFVETFKISITTNAWVKVKNSKNPELQKFKS